jgi:hypothetical protein
MRRRNREYEPFFSFSTFSFSAAAAAAAAAAAFLAAFFFDFLLLSPVFVDSSSFSAYQPINTKIR